ncbi:hypothetical protein B0T10DRAFT_482098 [Thelonectria olida]|uniref:Uncharacterized protein n=1 Tax=Thelonectria olida TaxID=1576542 RepID=A0A9P8WA60_9HYPO|nr:hypothetical protein B0T10DRAFT_482098 [Thelonectria olida]
MPTYYSSSSSQSYVSRSSHNGRTESHSYSEQTQTDPQGTTIRRAYRDNEKPVEYTEEHYPSSRRLGASGGQDTSRRIEDISEQEADRRYKEAIENEYAKREGGA